MPDHERELEIARWVSCYSEQHMGRYLGDPVLNDDGSADGLFDVRFDDPEPPIALEVTSIVDPHFIETARVAHSVADELTQLAVEEHLGRWYVEVVAGTRLSPIKQAILGAIKGNVACPRGVKNIKQADDGEPEVVIVTSLSDPQPIPQPLPGFAKELERAIKAKRAKLGRAEGYEHHLAVDLQAMRAQDPAKTPPPCLPPEIDVLWVVNTSSVGQRLEPIAWWSSGGEWMFSHEWPLSDSTTTGGYRQNFVPPPEVVERTFDDALLDGIKVGLSLECIARSVGIPVDEVIRRTEPRS